MNEIIFWVEVFIPEAVLRELSVIGSERPEVMMVQTLP